MIYFSSFSVLDVFENYLCIRNGVPQCDTLDNQTLI